MATSDSLWRFYLYLSQNQNPILSLCSNLSIYFKFNDVIELQILSFVYQWSHRLLPPVSVNISNLHPLFIPIQQGNRPREIFI